MKIDWQSCIKQCNVIHSQDYEIKLKNWVAYIGAHKAFNCLYDSICYYFYIDVY